MKIERGSSVSIQKLRHQCSRWGLWMRLTVVGLGENLTMKINGKICENRRLTITKLLEHFPLISRRFKTSRKTGFKNFVVHYNTYLHVANRTRPLLDGRFSNIFCAAKVVKLPIKRWS